jgi:uncharacterized protein YjdB
MMFMKKLIILILLSFFSRSGSAQTAASYTFSQSTGTYTALSGATNIFSGSWDDNVSNSVGIGFTFNQSGTNYTTYNVCANGWINFGSSITNTYTPISAKTHVASPSGLDLYYSPSGTVSYLLSGSSPNRILTIQWANCCHFSSSTTGPLNFQIKLYETSNIIEFVYGNFSPTSSTNYSCQVGINGNSTADYNNRVSTTTWTGTTAGGSNSATVRQSNTIKPTNGLKFRWCPPAPVITGAASICAGLPSTFSNSLSGGIWSSSNALVATVGSASGAVTGVTSGTATITYTPVCGAAATKPVTVLAAPANPSGSSSVCAGSAITLTDATGIGTWTSGSTSIATVGSASGIVTGLTAGPATITFTLGVTGCQSTKTITVNPTPPAISGPASVCIGASITLTDSASGTWTSSNTALASIASTSGVLTGNATGTPTITYAFPTGCITTTAITVNATPAAITGASSVCNTLSTTLSNALSGGTWSSSNIAVADVDATTGNVSGISAGTATITYTAATGCFVIRPMTINPFSAITGSTSVCIGSSTTLGNATAGGVWSSTNTTVAVIGSSSGILASGSAGTSIISYSIASSGCATATIVAVTGSPTIYNVTGGGDFCVGDPGVFVGLNGSDLALNYQLYNGSTPVGGTVLGTGTSFSFGLQSAGGSYFVLANPGTSCSAVMSGSAVATANILPVAYLVSGGGGYCSGGTGVHVYLNSSAIGMNYQLVVGTVPVGAPLLGTSAVLDFGLQTTTGIYSIEATNTITACNNTMAGTVTISLNTLPTAFPLTGGGGFCAGDVGVNVGLSNSVSGVSYQLFRGGTAVGGPLSGTGSTLDFGLQAVTGTYTVAATNTTTSCTNVSGTATVTENPLPTLFSVTGGGRYCFGGTGVNIGLNGSQSGVTYQLYISGISTGSSLSGSGSALDFGLQTSVGAYTVGAVNSTTLCARSMSGSVTVSINVLPAVSSVTGGGGYCTGGGGVYIGLSGTVPGTSYYLFRGAVLVDGASGTGGPIDFGVHLIAGTYTVSANIAATGCSAIMSGSATIIINPLPTSVAVTGGGNYCFGAAGLHVGLAGSASGISYQLLNDGFPFGTAAGTGSSLDFGFQTVAGNYTVIARNISTSCLASMTGSAAIAINSLPVTYMVTGGGGYCLGGTGLHVGLTSSNTGITYQLYEGTSASGSPVVGTGAALNFGLNTPGVYSVLATNIATTCTNSMSGTVSISVNPLPIAYIPTGGGNYCFGGSGVHIGLSNSTAGVNYTLYRGFVPAGSPVPGSGAPLAFGAHFLPATYSVRAMNATTGCTMAMPGTVTVGINSLPSAHLVTGGGVTCPGAPGLHVGLSGSGSGISYQLFNGFSAVGTPLSGTGSSLDFGLQTSAGTYSVVARNNITTCAAFMFGFANVFLNPVPAIFNVIGGGNLCAGGTGVSIGISGSSAGITYQLFNGASPVGLTVSGSGSALNFGMQAAPGTYNVKATNPITGCSGTMSGTAVVLVNPQPTIYAVTGGGDFCPGGAGVPVGMAGSDFGIEYQLFNGSSMVGSPSAGNGSPINFGAFTSPGAYTVSALNIATSCSVEMPGTVIIGISMLPDVFAITGGGSFCMSGPGVPVGLNGTQVNASYQLFKGGAAVGVAQLGTGFLLDFGLAASDGIYTVVASGVTSGCTSNMSGSALVVVNPLPVPQAVTGGGSLCAGEPGVHVGLGGSELGKYYQLHLGSSISGSVVLGTGAAIDFGLKTLPGTYSVIAADLVTGCSNGMSGSASVSISPLPGLFPVTGGGHYCVGNAAPHILLGGAESGVEYQLFNGGATVGTPVAGTSDIDFGEQVAAGAYTVVARNISAGCTRAMSGSASIVVDPFPASHTITGGGDYCAGGTGLHLMLSASDAGTAYQLFNGVTPVGSAVPGTGLALDFGAQSAIGAYTVSAVNNITACAATMAGSATIGVHPLPAVYTLSVSAASYCAGGTGVHILLSGSEPAMSYQLYHGPFVYGSPVAGWGGALDFGAVTASGIYTVIATNIASSCVNNMSGAPSITISASPAAFAVTGGGSFCTGAPGVNVGLSNSNVGISYQLYNGATTVGAPVAGAGGPLSFGLQTGPASYMVVATNVSTGCSRTMTGMANTAVNPLPVAYTVSGGGNYCSGGTGVHIGLTGSQSGVNYRLYNGSVLLGSAIAGSGLALDFGLQTAIGSYTIAATKASTTCHNDMLASVAVATYPLPVQYAVTGGGGYCAGGSGVPVSISNSGVGVSYQLYKGTSLVGSPVSGTGAALNFGLQTGPGSYTVVARNDATGCTNNMSGSGVVTINSLPNVYMVVGGGHYCPAAAGVHVGLAGSATGINYIVYQGFTPIVSLPGSGGPLDFGLITNTGSLTVTGINAATTCSATMTGSALVAADLLVSPFVYIASNAGDTICAGHFTTFSASTIGGGSAPTYIWSVNGAVAAFANNYSYIPANGDLLSVAVTSNAPCAVPGTVSASKAIAVTTNHAAEIAITASRGSELCQGTLVDFSASTLYEGNTPIYTWIKNNVSSGSGPDFNYIPANGDDIYCVLTSNYHCRIGGAVSSNHVHLIVDPAVIPSVAIVSNPGLNFPPGTTVTFQAQIANGGPEPVYQWQVNGNPVSGANSTAFSSSSLQNGDIVSCEVTGCSGLTGSQSVSVHVVGVGVSELSFNENPILLLPNPNNGTFSIKGTLGTATGDVTFVMTDLLGRVVYSQTAPSRNGEIDEHFSFQHLSNGTYILNLRSDAGSRVYYVIIKR